MSVNIEDLKPKPFKVILRGIELDCKPLRFSHALALAKLGNVFKEVDKATKEEIRQAEIDIDEVISELIPDLAGVELDISSLLVLMEQLMKQIEPSDNKELREAEVDLPTDPKAPVSG